MSRTTLRIKTSLLVLAVAIVSAVGLAMSPAPAMARTLSEYVTETTGTSFDRSDAYDAGDAAASSADDGLSAQSVSSVTPMSFSDRMLYFCKYESSQNYDQGLSSGDGYHAMGYFQFDNRYGLGNFLESVYAAYPDTFTSLKQIGDIYGWDVDANGGDTRTYRVGGRQYTLAEDLNWSWHQAYAADPTLFSQLQNGWAAQSYYVPAKSYLSSSYGIDLDSYDDCARGMCWGMCNLFGDGGWRKWAQGAGLSSSMSSRQFASSLANSLIAGISNGKYSYTYGSSYVSRYRKELDDCLGYLGSTVDELASANEGSVADGTYTICLASDTSKTVGVISGGTNVCVGSSSGSTQQWKVSSAGDGYVTIENVSTGKLLDVSAGTKVQGTNVQQWSSNGTTSQLWVPVSNGDGTYTFYSALGQGLVLDIAGGSTSDGANVEVYADNGTQAQRFVLDQSLDSQAMAHADDLADGTYSVSVDSSLSAVLDVAAGSTADGANVQAYASNDTDAQRWVVSHDASGYVTLTNVASGKVLDVAGASSAAGTNVRQWTSNGSKAQKWVAVRSSNGSYTLVSALGGDVVIDLAGGSTANGTNLQIWGSNGSSAQRFWFSDGNLQKVSLNKDGSQLASGCYTVSTGLSGSKVLDVAGGSTSDGGNVQIYSSNGTTAQTMYVSVDESGYVTLTDVGSGKVLDVAGGTCASGTNVQQYASNGSRAQKWVAVAGSDGSVTLWSALGGGQVLDVTAGSTVDGTNVRTYASNGTGAQQWRFSAHAALSDGTYVLESMAAPGRCLDVAGGSSSDGANVRIWTKNGTAAQSWKVTSVGDHVTITNVGSGKVLDVAGGSSAAGANVQQYSSNSTSAQGWHLTMTTSGLTIVSSLGTSLDVAGGLASDGTNVQTYVANGTSSQCWIPRSA
ncbi:MAG: RICIN domain-containing protein [Atopobiaceae bacterium]|jgi:hypothetical protein|nr:RICIN domain-containing protein [Atopobiaceae bacterium]MCI2173504.1 RICIN domain-containing protein [Atopobiaceae bacterium]MCI2207499.1 RICIN domain-containing protein [Atopobiaceae bacterium]